MATSKKRMKPEPVKVFKRETVKRSNAVIAREVIEGKFGANWEYNVRCAGYNVQAVKMLVESVNK